MTGLPSATFNTEFEHCDYRLALNWQLGLPLLPADTMGERCAQCGLCLDAFGDHAVSCKGNGITVRHGVIQDWLLERAKEEQRASAAWPGPGEGYACRASSSGRAGAVQACATTGQHCDRKTLNRFFSLANKSVVREQGAHERTSSCQSTNDQ